MKSDMVNMYEKIVKMERIVDRQEQYSCRNCLLLQGIGEGERENTDDLIWEILNEKIHVDLTSSELTVLVRRMFRRINEEQPLLNLLTLIQEKEIFLSIKAFKSKTS